MEYVRLGRTNLEVSRLGLGAMAFGSRRWRDWILEGSEAKPIIDRALDLGINFFDTSNYFSRKHIVHAVDASLRRLGTDYIDLYQTHIWNPDTDLDEMVFAFDHLVRAGKILHAGIWC